MKSPYRVLYSNDATNITTCVSPYHRKGERWRPEMLEATVDEVAGTAVDVHLIQLAHGQVPWYPSKLYPLEEHHAWWKERFGVDPENDAFGVGSVHRFILDGGDPLQIFIDRCRAKHQAPFISLRLNDIHHVQWMDTAGNVRGVHAISRFYVDHPEYRIGTFRTGLGSSLTDWTEKTLNWAIPQVRDRMFSMVKEQCENYDFNGFELDFMRFPSFFRVAETTSDERVRIITDWVSKVRRTLDETAPARRHRWLSIRIPAHLRCHDAIGVDTRKLADVGVEMINLSNFYHTEQTGDVRAIRELAGETAIYYEMCHCTRQAEPDPPPPPDRRGDHRIQRKTTSNQFYTTAHLALSRGADGVSLFNFAYYREHGQGDRGPSFEPPFAVLHHLSDDAWMAARPHHYIAYTGWLRMGLVPVSLPVTVEPGHGAEIPLLLAPPIDGCHQEARFRIQAENDLGSTVWTAELNGAQLRESPDRHEPFDNPYPQLLGTPAQHRAWVVPAHLQTDGLNHFRVTMTRPPTTRSHTAATIVFADLFSP